MNLIECILMFVCIDDVYPPPTHDECVGVMIYLGLRLILTCSLIIINNKYIYKYLIVFISIGYSLLMSMPLISTIFSNSINIKDLTFKVFVISNLIIVIVCMWMILKFLKQKISSKNTGGFF